MYRDYATALKIENCVFVTVNNVSTVNFSACFCCGIGLVSQISLSLSFVRDTSIIYLCTGATCCGIVIIELLIWMDTCYMDSYADAAKFTLHCLCNNA